MALSAGTRLGPYEILAPIGAGGMGEVYRARDTKLKRDVAVKVLPEAFARDPERMARFQREAEVLASLNHPNIAAIYGVEDRALIMELVEGESPNGPLPFDEAWHIASQIAAALEYAHDRGIVHRDLKPANIKITPDGTVKLLDFGLAKAFTTQADAPVNSENSPTLTIGATQVGVILGTAAYMSPEQAKGKSVDKRADIWAFGVVLYELLTGERPFKGEDVSDTLAQVLTKEPDLENVPLKVRKLLRRCLEKDPKKRLRDIGDAMPLLEDAPGRQAESPRHKWLLAAAAAILFLAGAGGAYFFRSGAPRTERVVKLTIPPPEGASFVDIATSGLDTLSPDGRNIAFVAEKNGRQMLWVRPLDSTEARELSGTDGAERPFWSPDSRSLGFMTQGKLKRIDLAGGSAQTLAEMNGAGSNGGEAAWSADGTILVATSAASNLFVIPAAGGNRAEATRLATGESSHLWPEFLPDGKHFLFHVRAAGLTEFQIYASTLGSSQRALLLKGVTNVRYAPPDDGHPGYLLYVRDGTLMAQPFDDLRMALTGDPIAIAQPVMTTINATGGDFSVAPGGILAYRSGAVTHGEELVWYDRSGKQIASVLKRPDTITRPRLSPDGKKVAFHSGRQGTGQSPDIWLQDLARGVASRFTFAGGQGPVWSPDGSRIAFFRADIGVLSKASNATGDEQTLWKEQRPLNVTDWSADGRFLLVTLQGDSNTSNDLWLLPVEGDRKPVPLLQSTADERVGRFSPGPGAPRWVAYQSNESGQNEIYVVTMPGQPPGKWQISNGGGIQPHWRRDARELYYVGTDSRTIMAVDIDPGPPFRAGTPHLLFRAESSSLNGNQGLEPAADGKRFLIDISQQSASTAPITVVLNWQAGLKK